MLAMYPYEVPFGAQMGRSRGYLPGLALPDVQGYYARNGRYNAALPGSELIPAMSKIDDIKDGIINKYQSKIRERAISQAKARIALSEKKMEDFTPDELEIIVKDEEDKVKRGLKQSALVALLITLGLA